VSTAFAIKSSEDTVSALATILVVSTTCCNVVTKEPVPDPVTAPVSVIV
jgi:hypothetical protein